ncbi:MAG: redoxin domain-containing protein, partial [Phycisphaerae bacterium]
MKKYLISTVVILIALAVAWPVLGQREGEEGRQPREGRRQFQDMPEEERAKLRERFQSMSEEEKEKFRAQMGERFGRRGPMFGREEQLKMIEAIEEQLANLKKAIEAGPEREAFRKLREASPEEQAKLRQEWQKIRQEQQDAINAIQEQLTRLGGRPPMARPDVPLKELQDIRELAVEENANKTAGRLEKLIARYQREPKERPQRPERPERGRERPTRPKRDIEGAASGKKAPDFTLTSFDDKTVSLSDYRGKIVVLEWFNFECPFVRYIYDKTTIMTDLANKYKDKNVVWFAVNSTSHTTPEANKAFTKKYRLPYLILDDRSGRVGHAYDARTTPHMFVIDTQGNIIYEGAIDNSPLGRKKEGVVNYVDKALAEL